ncbi:MAG: hypothetical protein NC131_17520 [Roseburia sp.]|nr:hypothetical protein [Roseburia sp.]
MANNSINGRFRKLYEEVKDNLSDESKDLLNSLYKRGSKSLHEFRNNLLKTLNNEYLKIINELAIERNIAVKEIDDCISEDKWFHYGVAIEKLNETIYDYRSEEEFNKIDEELLAPILNVSDEEFDYWQDVRNFVHEVTDSNDTDFISDENDDCPLKEHHRDDRLNDVEDIIEDRFVTVIQNVKNDLKITGQIIDFMIGLYSSETNQLYSE